MIAAERQLKTLYIGLACIVLAGGLLLAAGGSERLVPVTFETTESLVVDGPPGIWFLLDDWGYSPPTDGDDTPVQHSVRVGTAVQVGAGVNEYVEFDASRVWVTVNGRQLPTAPRTEGGTTVQVATYIPEKPGKELITVEVLGTPHREYVEVAAYAAELMGETRLIREDIAWEGDWAGYTQIDTVKPPVNYPMETTSPWEYDEPGYLRIRKTDDLIRTEGELRIYDISTFEQHRNDEALPYFFEHILKLERYLVDRGDLSDEEMHDIFAYPRTNAAMIRLERNQFIDGAYFDGVSYIHAGHFQAYDPAQQPTYIYQGISHDKRFFVFYRQELYSDALRQYLRKNDWCVEKECIEGSFDLLERDQALDPNPRELNELVRSITIRKQ